MRPKRVKPSFGLFVCVVAIALGSHAGFRAGLAVAGDRPLAVLLVNMTPDAKSTARSRSCVEGIHKWLRSDARNNFQDGAYAGSSMGYEVSRMGESRLRKLVRKKQGDDFMGWAHDVLKPAIEKNAHEWQDSVALVDCRPEEGVFRALVTSAARGKALVRLEGLHIDSKLHGWLAETLAVHGWVGFSP